MPMSVPSALYRSSLALLTDLYQLTMAYGYYRSGARDTESVFHLFYRRNPFKSGFAIACGLAQIVDLVEHFHFDESDIAYLATLTGGDNQPLFDREFLGWLSRFRLSVDIDAIPEGTVVFPHEPLVRVRGPIIDCQLLETAFLNMINFETLIATKAARIVHAAGGDPVLEFGLRRAQGIDGGLSASRAAYIGGCEATSNVLAGKLFGIPVKGTHAHSWVMSFGDELAAFEAYARAMPNNCVFLVDTYDTIEGVHHAVQVGKWLRENGGHLAGVRLDSGDLAQLSIEARRILDEGGFPEAKVIASNDLDEHVIASLKQQGAQIAVWGVGTRLVTAFDDPAMGGVYKLSAVRKTPSDPWQHRIKLSEQAIKVSTPGILQVRRFESDHAFVGDAIFDESLPRETGSSSALTMVDLADVNRLRTFEASTHFEDLLVPIARGGKIVRASPPLIDVRARAANQLQKLPATTRRFLNPQTYNVGLEASLHELKTRLIREARTHEKTP